MNRLREHFGRIDAPDSGIRLHDDEWGDSPEFEEGCAQLDDESYFPEEQKVPGESDWMEILSQALAKTLIRIKEGIQKDSRLNALEERLNELENRLAETVTRDSVVVPITTFAPEPFQVLKEIKAVIQKEDEDEFTATFFDANVNATGCNQVDAIDNLKDLILSRFEFLNAQSPEKLGLGLAKQIAVLREFVARRQ